MGNINKCNIYGIPSEFDNMASSTYQLPPVLVQTNMDSDGILYGFGDGTSRCSKNQKNEKPKPLEQNFKAYEKCPPGKYIEPISLLPWLGPLKPQSIPEISLIAYSVISSIGSLINKG